MNKASADSRGEEDLPEPPTEETVSKTYTTSQVEQMSLMVLLATIEIEIESQCYAGFLLDRLVCYRKVC